MSFAARSGFAVGLCFALVLFAVHASAMPSNPCTVGWSDNEIIHGVSNFTCNEEKAKDWAMKKLSYLFIPGVIGIIVFLVFPFYCVGRYCCQCCGASKMRPGGGCCGGDHWDGKPEEEKFEAYTFKEVNIVRFGSVALLAFPALYITLSYIGAAQLLKGVDDTIGAAYDIVVWVINDMNTLSEALKNPDGSYPSAFGPFTDKYSTVSSNLNTIKTDYVKNSLVDQFKDAVTGFGFPVLLPGIFVFVGAVAALLRLRLFVPMICCVALYILAAPFGIGSTIFYLASAPLDVLCGETEAQLDRQPGIFQNFIIPNCDEVNPVAAMNRTIYQMSGDIARGGCSSMLSICDTRTTYDLSAGSEVYWFCTPIAGGCTNLAEMSYLLNSMTLKTGVPSNPCGTSAPAGVCTMEQCRGSCTTSSLRTTAGNVITTMSEVAKIEEAVSNSEVLTQWSTCNGFFDHILIKLKLCDNLPGGVKLLGSAFFIVVVSNIAGIVFMTLGSKRFFDRQRYERGSNAAFGKTYANMNGGAVVVPKRSNPPESTNPSYEVAPATTAAPPSDDAVEMGDLDTSLL